MAHRRHIAPSRFNPLMTSILIPVCSMANSRDPFRCYIAGNKHATDEEIISLFTARFPKWHSIWTRSCILRQIEIEHFRDSWSDRRLLFRVNSCDSIFQDRDYSAEVTVILSETLPASRLCFIHLTSWRNYYLCMPRTCYLPHPA